jgi:gliding motility-associated-like protein
MKNIVAAFLLIAFAAYANAQTFQKRTVLKLDEKLSNINAEWIAIDPDTLLDLVVMGIAPDGQLKIVPFQNPGLTRKTVQATGMTSGNVQIADWNKDNKLDLLISDASGTFAFTGNGNFTFTKQTQKLLNHTGKFLVADMNNNGVTDLVTFGDQFIRVYENGSLQFELTDTSLTDLAVFDMNRDGFNDMIFAGHILFGTDDFKFTLKEISQLPDVPFSLADINDDGLFDVITANGAMLINRTDTLLGGDTFAPSENIFTGDMNSDGKPDLLLSKKQSNYIRELSGITTNLDTTGLILQRMGDNDRDGDLDLVQVVDSIGSQWLKLYENTSVAVNQRPKPTPKSFAISTFDKTFIIWEGAEDDRTVAGSLTYDVWLGNGGKNIIQPSYDLGNLHRSLVRHGNAGTNTAMVINGLTDDRYFYGIQTVDNAYNGSYEYGACGTGTVLPCFDLVHTVVQACKGLPVRLPGDKGTTWYSMAKGILGEMDTLTFVANANDTIFAFVPQSTDCSKNKVYVVNVNEAPPSERETIYACREKEITLRIAEGWAGIKWDTSPPVNDVASISYKVSQADTVTATATSQGCTYVKTFFIKISEPVVTIEGDGFQVLKGSSVQLEATGNVDIWEWSPSEGLSSTTIPDPTATPAVSTEYVVTGTDSVGCTAEARVNVFVQENAFLPNLFTPNGDGRNDNLMIYGLTNPSKFNFRIFNREGSLVYETKDAGQATTVGWNGYVAGNRQPSGIYYWRIDGEMSNGDKLMLNGKTTGSILLVH